MLKVRFTGNKYNVELKLTYGQLTGIATAATSALTALLMFLR